MQRGEISVIPASEPSFSNRGRDAIISARRLELCLIAPQTAKAGALAPLHLPPNRRLPDLASIALTFIEGHMSRPFRQALRLKPVGQE